MDRRLQSRYKTLVTQQLQSAQGLASGLHALPSAATPFAATQAAWRFLANPRVRLPQLAEPLRQSGREAAAASRASHLLVVHDWSFLSYGTHASKTDRIKHGHSTALGYDLATALLVDGKTGDPLAPMELELTTAGNVVSTRVDRSKPLAHIDQILETMDASVSWGVKRPLVHIIDREADGLAQFRTWSKAGHSFVVRVDANRRVQWQDQSRRLPEIAQELQQAQAFTRVGSLGVTNTLHVAETAIVYAQPGRVRRGKKRVLVPGEPLRVRLVVSQVRANDGSVKAEWLLVTNLGAEVSARQIGEWYAWRWRIESFFKLLKSHGVQAESWEQESGQAIAKRLAVAAMACVLVWRLMRDKSRPGRTLAKLLIRLSGRQMKATRPVTASALLAGLEKLLGVLELLEKTTVEELRKLLNRVLPMLHNTS